MAGSGQRAFAQKLNKGQHAADIRRQVSSHYSSGRELSRGSSISSGSLGPGSIPLSDVIEPLDFEEYIQQNIGQLNRDPLRHLLEFPPDDVAVKSSPRQFRTVKPSLPEPEAENNIQVRDCLHAYTCDWSVVERKYLPYVTGHESSQLKDKQLEIVEQQQHYEVDELDGEDDEFPLADSDSFKRSSIRLSDGTPRSSWASSIFDLKNSEMDDLLPRLLEHIPVEKQDEINTDARLSNRNHHIFRLYPALEDADAIERRSVANVPQDHFGYRLMIKCLTLKLELEVEPIMASMALYDVREKKKISENFYFDLNTDTIKNMIKPHLGYPDVSSLARSAVFSITYPSSDVYIVIKLEKVLQQGDISECAEPYMKESDSAKHVEKVKANAKYCCERLGAYRMPFAWTAVHLMHIINGASSLDRNSDGDLEKRTGSLDLGRKSSSLKETSSYGSLPRKNIEMSGSGTLRRNGSERRSFYRAEEDMSHLQTFHPVTITVSSFFKQESDKLTDEDLFKFLADLKRPTSVLKRLKCIPGSLKLDISPMPENPPYCLTPDLQQVEPYPDLRTRPTREIQEFPSRDVYVPHNAYINTLYLYPKCLNFSNRAGSARNIAVKVQFMAGEDQSTALQCISGKSSCPEFSRHAYTAVTYHNRSPDFYEEIKIKLPADLDDRHHLLFTFYHISCQKKQDTKDIAVETPIGYTWLPCLKDSRLVTGDLHLPVSMEMPPSGYSMLSPEVQLPTMKWVDGHKSLFSIHLTAVSSIHAQDKYIDRFLSLCHAVEEGKIPRLIGEQNMESDLIRSTIELTQSVAEPLVKFLHIILNKLVLMMTHPPIVAGHLVNMGQVSFETIAQIVDRIHTLLDNAQDTHGRNSLLSSYIQYVFRTPDGEDYDCQGSPHSLSPGSTNNYGTVTRSSSFSIKQQFGHMRNASSASLHIANSPDDEVEGILHSRYGSERNTAIKQSNRSSLSNTGMGNVPVHGLGGRVPPKKVVHEEIALQLVVCNGKSKEMALNHAWFFFELMVKSMAQFLEEKDAYGSPRRMRFPESFCNDIASIVNLVVHDIIARYNKDVRQMQLLNASLAFFLQDLFSFMDRGFVLSLIRIYCKQVSGKITALADPTTLAQLKLDFLRLISSHEHYVTLNLPFLPPSMSQPPSPTPSIQSISSYSSFVSTWTTVGEQNKMTELSTEYRQQHYLTALLLSDLANVLQTHNSNLHRQAIDMVCNLLASHDADERYTDPDCRMRVASLYVPLLSIVMDALPQLNCSNADPKAKPSAAMGDDNATDTPLQQSVAMAIAGSSVFASSDSRVESAQVQRPPSHTRLTEESTRDLLMCFLWVVKNMDPRVLQSWWASLESSRINHLLDVCFYCVCAFEYKGKNAIFKRQSRMSLKKSDVKQRLEEVILGMSSARSDMIQRHSRQGSLTDKNFNPALGQAEKLRWRKDQTHWKQNIETPTERPIYELEQEAILEGHLATEVALVVVDALELLVGTISSADHLQGSLTGVMGVLLHALACNQSITVLQNILATQRSLVFKYPELLFEEETEQCADLCLRLLHHCSSCISVVRSHASASLYLLMRQNFEIGNNFARVKMQVTMSLSSLVGTETNFHEEYLRRSLKTILTYAEEDVELQQTSFPEQVRELVFNLHMILSDTVKMKEFQEDPEMLLDLMYRIAKGYQNSPDLRLTWLQNMAGKHTENKNFTEAAQCLVHAAALVAEYLHMLEDRPHLPVGCVSFARITPNVLEESAVSDDVVSPDEEGICTGKYFTESGLVGLLETSAASFNQAGKYETMNEVYRILIPIHEANRDYRKLSIIHGKLQEAFNKIVHQGNRRLFGTYFRVGFYGVKFGDLDGAEFVYKEPAITKLPEIAHRLENFYSERFGQDTVEVIKDSNTVNRDKQDPNKAYIQVTYVEPYFDYHELLQRPTYFDRNYNIRRFMYATPFTKDGRAHGDLQEQYKRKTILTTSHAFPYIKTRVNVIDKAEIVLSPVQVAIEDIQKKTKELEVATLTDPPDAKMLQMVLQGCIGTTVNQGPMEVALVFLGDTVDGSKPLDKHHNKLRLCFKDFSKKCGDALRKNKNLITPDQREYQRELERNYHRFTDRLMPLISNRTRVGSAGSTGTLKRGSSSKMMMRKDSNASQISIKSSETL